MSLRLRLLFGIVVLPVNVMVVIPAILIWLTAGTEWGAQPRTALEWPVWLGVAFAVMGLILMIATVTDFFRVGEGTPAPWDPPKNMVVKGPYRYVRNPMISGVIIFLFAEALIFHSWALTAWLGFFVLINGIYIPMIEERKLEERFGDTYRLYKQNVPRWIPRMTPWQLPLEE